jgi:general stress protein YciG
MSPERRRAIASKGGKSVPADKRAFSQARDLASAAGRKGGLRSSGGRRPAG